jgi:hypothetical protein
MTDATTPEEIGVREEDHDTSSSAASKDEASDSGETTTTPRRRRSRGGRGRSSSRSRAAAGNEVSGATVEPAKVGGRGADNGPEIDLDAQPGETERVEATIEVSADGQVT